MSYSVSATPKFKRELKRLARKYPSLRDEYAQLIETLANEPHYGTPIGSDGYKIRLSIAGKGKGKSGGVRVITYVYVADEIVYLLSIYDKSEKANISDNEILGFLREIK